MFGDTPKQFKLSPRRFETIMRSKGPGVAIQSFRRAYRLKSMLKHKRSIESATETETSELVGEQVLKGSKTVLRKQHFYRFQMAPLIDVEILANNYEHAQYLAANRLHRSFVRFLRERKLASRRFLPVWNSVVPGNKVKLYFCMKIMKK